MSRRRRGGLPRLLAGWGLTSLALACAPPERTASPPFFVDSPALDFTHQNGARGDFSMVEVLSGGTSVLDYDGDGDLDVYAVQGVPLEAGAWQGAAEDRLFRNDGRGARDGELHFVDVTARAGLEARGYGMAVAVGDLDGDGWLDLYRTAFGRNQLWRNRRDGSYLEIRDSPAVETDGWSSAAAFADLDRDGDDDLWVVNYLRYALTPSRCTQPDGSPDYCGPDAFPPAADQVFLNTGSGHLEDVSLATGVALAPAPGLGILIGDWNEDGRAEVLVANDHAENQLWVPRDTGPWVDEGPRRGVAVNALGAREASMGVAGADFDDDGDEDLFLTHLRTETNTLYVNQGGGVFLDQTEARHLGLPSWGATGFGAEWLDFDGDGLLDLVTVNGHVRLAHAGAEGRSRPAARRDLLAQVPLVFRGTPAGVFSSADAKDLGAWAAEAFVGRGLTLGDLDGDGSGDLLLSVNGGALRTLLGRPRASTSWWGLDLRTVDGRPTVDCDVDRLTARGRVASRSRRAASYLASRDPRVVRSAQRNDGTLTLEVRCGGTRSRYAAAPLDRYLVAVVTGSSR